MISFIIRCKALGAQNATLLQALESVSSQASRIQQAATTADPGISTDGTDGEDNDARLTDLRAVVSYLRKEKEIIDLQLELSKQENASVKAQVDHLSQSLAEARSTLSAVSHDHSSQALSFLIHYICLGTRTCS